MKVSSILLKRPDNLGRGTVYIAVYNNGKRSLYATPIKIEPKYWKRKVINHPRAKYYNDRIKELITSYETKKPIEEKKFYHFAIECIDKWSRTKKASTLKALLSKAKKFKDFSDCYLTDVSTELLEQYAEHCYSFNSQNTVWSTLKDLRTFINEADRLGLIQVNPYKSFKMPQYRNPEKEFLTKEQVKQIEKFLKGSKGEYRTCAGWFLISCYTGLRYGDQATFNKSKIKDGRLIIYTSKTGKVVSIKLNSKLKELFTIVNYKPIPYSNQHYNRILKAISAILELPKISAHMGRHTFGTFCAAAGMSIEVTALLMGHSSIRTTAIYYSLTSPRIDSEFGKIF